MKINSQDNNGMNHFHLEIVEFLIKDTYLKINSQDKNKEILLLLTFWNNQKLNKRCSFRD